MSPHTPSGEIDSPKIPAVCVVGPTGSGKSHLAMALARQLNGEIVNCDSLQVYRGFDIGTAKPTTADLVEIPHHLIDIADPSEEFTAGDFARHAGELITTITDRQKLPVVAGGTGFYLKALVDGLVEGPRRDEMLRQRLAGIERRRAGVLHRVLRAWDPSAAERIHAADVQKLVRALEVIVLERQPLSKIYTKARTPSTNLRVYQVGLDPPRQALYARLDRRSQSMLDRGLIEETRALLQSGLPENAKPFGAIGYKQALSVLRGEMSVERALEEMQRDTRRYAKRQWTWFRRDKRVNWVTGFGDDVNTHQKVVELLHKALFWY